MRVNTAFNRILRLVGATVHAVEFTGDGVVVTIRPGARIHRCPCGRTASGYDRSRRRSRHLDLGACGLWPRGRDLAGELSDM